MDNTSTSNSANDYLEQNQQYESRLIAIIAVVVMIGFASLLAYMFFGYQ
jgi:hypothetical protein